MGVGCSQSGTEEGKFRTSENLSGKDGGEKNEIVEGGWDWVR